MRCPLTFLLNQKLLTCWTKDLTGTHQQHKHIYACTNPNPRKSQQAQLQASVSASVWVYAAFCTIYEYGTLEEEMWCYYTNLPMQY